MVTIDLSREMRAAREAVGSALARRVGPWIESQLHSRWPRLTGRSADAWTWDPVARTLTNGVDYTPYINLKNQGGLALDNVLTSIVREAQAIPWAAE